MTTLIYDTPTAARQYPGAMPIRSNGAATIQTRPEQNKRFANDKCHYHSTNKRSVTDLTPRQIPGVSNLTANSIAHLLDLDERRRVVTVAALVTIRRRALDILLRAATALRRVVMPVVIAGLLTAGPMPIALLPATCPVRPTIDTSPIVEAAKRKQLNQEVPMVIQHPTADIQPNSHTVPVAANGTRVWAGASPTPGTGADD